MKLSNLLKIKTIQIFNLILFIFIIPICLFLFVVVFIKKLTILSCFYLIFILFDFSCLKGNKKSYFVRNFTYFKYFYFVYFVNVFINCFYYYYY